MWSIQDVTHYLHGIAWDITSVVLLLYMVAPPQGSIKRRMGFGVEESAEVGNYVDTGRPKTPDAGGA